MAEFLSDVETLRKRARANIEQVPITEAYGADRERVIAVLNEVLATEIVCPASTTVPETVARSTGHRNALLMIGMMIRDPRSAR